MILLSFDIEEFDVPKEHRVQISLEEQIRISVYGTHQILDCLQCNDIKATFFCTANFAIHAPEILKRILDEGHELASHGFYHWTFEVGDLKKSKEKLEELSGVQIRGYRQARMMPVPELEIRKAGYEYNSSLNPTFIPGRYMHLTAPRTCFMKEQVLQIPASVTPLLRFPLFWLSCHNLPASVYRRLCSYTLKHDGYLTVYFHPWEFYPLNNHPELKIPFIIRNHSGQGMVKRLNDFVHYFKQRGKKFITFSEFTAIKKQELSGVRE
ncbi:polysaccharide deacetylase family protein [Bacteroides sp.]|uniref:polysaccharide deacetylase family protein n=1 Tax=Bacteroides sp. TaxID=29523 RepID=UPI001B4A562C|nr:polysaccharide deacetylase family protein [Bacteroides sp.]MBP6064534.1 polysaccharide deacetylase family protein [Bacteroides sp.]MBP6066695.1 polysaccharide deacetylase family protein [Bacteroides sp.]MBP6935469.1 polysaccharide deacetylase family protein [Bacteroides sp.]MBP9585337.1 polysaccharide deacetylase family protein [Bacteroides sp.]